MEKELQLLEIVIMARRCLPDHIKLTAESRTYRDADRSFSVYMYDTRGNCLKALRNESWYSHRPDDRSLEKWLHGIILKNGGADEL